MAETYTLDAEHRTLTGKKVSQLRTQGLVPAVIYGAKVTEPIHLQIPYRALELMLAKAGGTHLIDIAINGQVNSVLARDVQRNVMNRSIMHVDFLAVDKTQKIETDIAVLHIGESAVIKTRLGELQIDLQSLHVEALPADLVDSITIDISALSNIGDIVHVRDLVMPSGVTALNDPDESVLRIVAVRIVTDEELAADIAPATSEPERIERKKDDDFDE